MKWHEVQKKGGGRKMDNITGIEGKLDACGGGGVKAI